MYAELVINEIYPAPTYQNIEWIELYNNSHSEINLNDLWINDLKTSKQIDHLQIKPYSYCILCKDTLEYFQYWSKADSCIYKEVSLPGLNNDTDVIVFRNSDSLVLDSIFYEFDIEMKGYSLEKVNPDFAGEYNEIFFYSMSPDSCTPGEWNSISNGINDVYLNYAHYDNGIAIVLKNNLKFSAKLNDIEFWVDKDNDGIFSAEEKIKNINLSDDTLNDSLIYTIDKQIIIECTDFLGSIYFKAEIKAENDIDNSNNIIIGNIINNFDIDALKFNELLPNPDDGNAEFVELYNSSNYKISPNDLMIKDFSSDTNINFINFFYPSPIIEPMSLAVIIWDSTFYEKFPELIGNNMVKYYSSSLNLNINNELIYLYNAKDEVLDSLHYSMSWYNGDSQKNRSLEKINPVLQSDEKNSWALSAASKGATPLQVNSMFQEEIQSGELTATPNPFAPNGINNDNFCIIHYELPFENVKIDADIYTENAVKVKTLADNFYSTGNNELIWDGTNDEGYKLDIGQYILVFKYIDSQGNTNIKKLLIVIGA